MRRVLVPWWLSAYRTHFKTFRVRHTVVANRTTESYNIPPLRPPVLEPRLHLSVGHLEGLGEGGAFRRRQVLLLVKPLLQFGDLKAREGRPRLLPLRGCPVLVGVADPPGHRERRCNNGQG